MATTDFIISNFKLFFTKAAEFTKESNEKICEVVSGVNVYYGVMYNRGPYVIEAQVLNQEPEEE